MTCLKCQHGIAKKFGTYGKQRVRRFRCNSCRATRSCLTHSRANHMGQRIRRWLASRIRPPPLATRFCCTTTIRGSLTAALLSGKLTASCQRRIQRP